MTLIFEPGARILFIGDSITDAGRRLGADPLGAGFVRRFADTLAAAYPQHELTIMNRGVSGDTTSDLLVRWPEDAIALQPDWIVLLIGVNDVWRFISQDLQHAVSVGGYEQNLRRLLLRTASDLPEAKMLLLEPFLVEDDPRDLFRQMLDRYRAVLRALADEKGLPLVRLQDAFDAMLHHGPAATPLDWAGDQVHPTPAGHDLIARTVLAACGHEPPNSP